MVTRTGVKDPASEPGRGAIACLAAPRSESRGEASKRQALIPAITSLAAATSEAAEEG